MKVSEIMTSATVVEAPDLTVADAARRMREQQTGSLLVAGPDGGLAGIVTERDVLRAVAEGIDVNTSRVADLMRRELVTVDPGTSLREAARIMADHWIRHLPVLESGKLVGIVSQRDLAGVLAGALNEPDALEQLVEASQLVRERRLRRIEAGTWD